MNCTKCNQQLPVNYITKYTENGERKVQFLGTCLECNLTYIWYEGDNEPTPVENSSNII